ncbi:MAG TPA: dsRBD fold-containing protein [Actinomycetes bacterium]|nr:dsRBD fold-containing protein [Actinomycetes bacterium]
MQTNEWTVHLYFEEDDDDTHAKAVLRTRHGESLRAIGKSERHPADSPVPEIGAELAAARALHALAYQLTAVALADITALARKH